MGESLGTAIDQRIEELLAHKKRLEKSANQSENQEEFEASLDK